MANIRQAAQNILAEAREEIAWLAFWKEGRGWASAAIWPEDFDEKTGRIDFEDYDRALVDEIVKKDAKAILVNGYYDNLGSAETMTRDSLADALRWHYERQTATLAGYVGG